MRVVFDTNVVVTGLLWTGTPREILRSAEQGLFQLVTSEAIIEELRDVLDRNKFSNRLQKLNKTPDLLISDYLGFTEVVNAEDIAVPFLRDPDDAPILACALAGQANYIVSGDPDLLTLTHFETISIVNPAQFAYFVSLI